MEDVLFVGASQEIDLDAVVKDASCCMTELGFRTDTTGLMAMEVLNKTESRVAHGLLGMGTYIRLLFDNQETFIGITQFETEIVPGYSIITEPVTISVGLWVGASATNRAIAACVAMAIATQLNGKILDSEHKWSDVDLNEVGDFMEKLRMRYNF